MNALNENVNDLEGILDRGIFNVVDEYNDMKYSYYFFEKMKLYTMTPKCNIYFDALQKDFKDKTNERLQEKTKEGTIIENKKAEIIRDIYEKNFTFDQFKTKYEFTYFGTKWVTEDFYNRIKKAGEKDPKQYDNIIKYIDLSKVTAAAPAGGKSMKKRKFLKSKKKSQNKKRKTQKKRPKRSTRKK